MTRRTEGRVRYDEANDSFVYEIRPVDETLDEYGDVIDEEVGEWGMCLTCPCVRREGAEEGEEANYIHYSMLKQVVYDVWNFGTRVRLA